MLSERGMMSGLFTGVLKTTGSGWRRMRSVLAVFVVMGWAGSSLGQDVRIRYRPLTPQEIKDYGLPAETQKSGGAANAGLGQPVYLEALLSNNYAGAVAAVNWTLIEVPAGSTNVVGASLPTGLPLTIPTYDGGDRDTHFVAGRATFRPDAQTYFDFNPSVHRMIDYKVRTDIVLTNGSVMRFTNSLYGSLYIGQKDSFCVACHADKQAGYEATDHANAFIGQITGEGSDHFQERCISCHTLGFDETPGAVNGGFDDVAASLVPPWTFPGELSPTNWTGMPTNLQNKANVQCESCHGPASTHKISLGDTNAIDVTLSAGTCGQCHDSLPHHIKPYEWGQSLHSTGYVFRFSGSCIPCHSSRGFIETWDPVYSADTNRVPRGTDQEGIACAACHDPHTPGMGEHQLRNINTAELLTGRVITEAEAGVGVLCMNCHHARYSWTEHVEGPFPRRFGPHYGPQADMLAAENGYEYGMELPTSRHLWAVENSCVGCHMQLIAGTSFSNAHTKVGGHTFKISSDNGTPEPEDDIHVTEVCSVCHIESGTFDFGGEDYDRDGMIEGVQSEIRGLMDTLGRLLPPLGSPTVSPDEGYTLSQKQAAWNYLFVEEDQSHGVHNPKYAAALLQASIDDLSGGIDVDRDGLPDSWEIEKFGDLTSETGEGDADEDGLSNAKEYALGTEPDKKDSDNDGFFDLAEIQYGSNPRDIDDYPTSDDIFVMLPALELGFLPAQTGTTQTFQSVDMLDDGAGWIDAGPSYVSSNGVAYQLISLRDSTQKFYRVIQQP